MLGDFSQQADAYQRSRAGYPSAIADQLVDDAGVAELANRLQGFGVEELSVPNVCEAWTAQ